MEKQELKTILIEGKWEEKYKDIMREQDLLNLLQKNTTAEIDDNDLDMVMQFFDATQQAKEQEKEDKEQEKVRDKKKKFKENKKSMQEEKKKLIEEMKVKAREEEAQAEKIAIEFNKSIVCTNQDITKFYSRLRKSIEITAQGYFNSVYIQGRAGIGKSYQDTAKLNEMGFTLNNEKNPTLPPNKIIERNKKVYTVFSGDMSVAYVYRFLYEHNGKVIIFRDLSRLISAIRSIDILKAVTETHGKRIVQKALYSKEQEDLPNDFICESRFIFEMNSLNFDGILKEDIDALLSRGDYLNLVFSFGEIASIMEQIATTEDEKKVTRYLIDNYRFVGWNNFNLRTQNKAFKIYQHALDNNLTWEAELKEFLDSEMSGIRRELYTYMGLKAIKSSKLKIILCTTHIANCWNLRTADRRIREYILMRELFIVGFVCDDDDELEAYLETHKGYYVSLNPIETVDFATNTTQNKTEITASVGGVV